MSKKKKIIIMVLVSVLLGMTIGVIAYAMNRKTDMNAEQIVTKLQEANLPIDNVIVYNEQNDKNKLLGRPNQYTSKVNFADTHIQQFNDTETPNGGSIEVFRNPIDLNDRKSYIESIVKKSPVFTEYILVNGNYLLRLSKDLTNEQVEKYKEAFMNIK